MDIENMQPNSLPPQTQALEPKTPSPLTPSKAAKLPPLQSIPIIPVIENINSSETIVIGESFSLQERFARFRKDKQRVLRNQVAQSQHAHEVLPKNVFPF